MNNDNLCIADQGGVENAMQYIENLQNAGAVFEIDYDSAITGFRDWNL